MGSSLNQGACLGPQTNETVRWEASSGGTATGTCPFRGCRAPELAAGGATQSQLALLMRHRSRILDHLSAGSRLGLEEQTTLVSDWHSARQKIWGSSVFVCLCIACQIKQDKVMETIGHWIHVTHVSNMSTRRGIRTVPHPN